MGVFELFAAVKSIFNFFLRYTACVYSYCTVHGLNICAKKKNTNFTADRVLENLYC